MQRSRSYKTRKKSSAFHKHGKRKQIPNMQSNFRRARGRVEPLYPSVREAIEARKRKS